MVDTDFELCMMKLEDRDVISCIGEFTNYKNYHVGDIVTFKTSEHVNVRRYGVVIKGDSQYLIYSAPFTDIHPLNNVNDVLVFKKYKDASIEDYLFFSNTNKIRNNNIN